jgi:predicted transcriptional regulator
MNFQQLVTDLNEAGMSEADIGSSIGLSQAQVHRLKTGESKQPKWESGQKLVALHKSRLKPKKSAA